MLVDEFKEMIDRLNTVLCVYDFDEDTCESIQSAIDDLEEAISTLVNEGDDEEGDEEQGYQHEQTST